MLDYCEYDFARLRALFGNIRPQQQNLPFQVTLVPGVGNASNDGPSAIPSGIPPTISCYIGQDGCSFAGIAPLVVAEEAEIFMVIQNNGWNPGWSDAEALSRVSPQILYPVDAWLFSTGADWFNSSTYMAPADRVDNVEPTDPNPISIGCGALFLSYLAYQLNFTWPAIIGAGALTTNALAETATLLAATGGYATFLALLQANFPTGNLYAAGSPFNEQTDDVYPLDPLPAALPALYVRHNTADNGMSNLPPLSSSPDIIVKNAQVANPQGTFPTAASIASATESDPFVLDGQANYVYLRVWNRGAQARNVFAMVYWSPPSTLVTPPMWNLIGSSYYPEIPAGGTVEVSALGLIWPADRIPSPGHYCFVATVVNNYRDAPSPQSLSFGSFNDYVNYIASNSDIAWRNFNVVELGSGAFHRQFGDLHGLPFQI